MASLELTRIFAAPLDRVWGVLGDPARPPGPGIEVEVLSPAAPDGTGLVRNVKPGRGTFREEITAVDPPRRLEYRMLKGAPVRDYKGVVTLAEAPDGTRVHWAITFRPVIPGTGWLVERASRTTLAQVLDAVAVKLRDDDRGGAD